MVSRAVAFVFLVTALPATVLAQNHALQFDGVDDLVRIPHHSTLSLQAMTVEAWIWIDSPAFQRRMVVSKGPNFGNFSLSVLGNQGVLMPGTASHVHQTATGNFSNTGCCLTFGQWQHVATTYSGGSGGTAVVYINGQLIGGMPVTSTQAPLENLQDVILGQLAGANFLFQGLLDEVRIWNVERTATEIEENYDCAVPSSTPGLVAYWRFDEPLGDQTVLDSSPLGNHGTLGVSAAVQADDPLRVPSTVPISLCPIPGPTFIRGDANASGGGAPINIADAIYVLAYLFSSGPAPSCLQSADANDDDQINVGDPVSILGTLFSGGPAPPAPYPACGLDPTPGVLSCASFPPCGSPPPP